MIPFRRSEGAVPQHQAGARRRRRSACSTAAQFVLGEEVAAFEHEFAAYCGAEHAHRASTPAPARCTWRCSPPASGRATKSSPCRSPSSPPSRRSATPARTPVFVDIDPRSLHDGPGADRGGDHAAHQGDHAGASLRAAGRHGRRSWRSPRRHGLPVIEDAARRTAPSTRAAASARIGDVGCFSFYPGKNLGAYGEGGDGRHQRRRASPTHDAHAARLGPGAAVPPRAQGLQLPHGRHPGRGPARQAAPPRGWTEARRAHAAAVRPRCSPAAASRRRSSAPDARHVYHVYAVRTPDRDDAAAAAAGDGIQTGIHYPIPVHLQPAYADLGYRRGRFPAVGARRQRGAVAADVPGADVQRRSSRSWRRPSRSRPMSADVSRPASSPAVHGAREVERRPGVRARTGGVRCEAQLRSAAV